MSLIYKMPNLFDGEESTQFPWPIEISLPMTDIQLPAEWETQSCVMIAYPHENTDWDYMLNEAKACFKEIAQRITEVEDLIIATPHIESVKKELSGLNIERIKFLEIDTNDTWARDFGGITVRNKHKLQVIDYKFNGWGLKFASDKDNLITSRMFNSDIFAAEYINQLSFVLEGGSIESDGAGTILTTTNCLLSPNRNGAFTKDDIESYLKWSLGANRILWLEHGELEGDDTDSHIDTLARFISEDSIAYVKCYDDSDSHFNSLSKMETELKSFKRKNGESYNLIALPLPNPIYDENGMRLPATYANFLIMNNRVLVPTYNQPENDSKAINALKSEFPNREIIGINCTPLIRQHGSLHCVTMQFPKGTLK